MAIKTQREMTKYKKFFFLLIAKIITSFNEKEKLLEQHS